jgi:hypothetical protein
VASNEGGVAKKKNGGRRRKMAIRRGASWRIENKRK